MTRKRKTKPFPWRCPKCLKREVRPSTVEYSTQAKYEGRLYDVAIPEFVVPTCPACGELVFCNDTDEQISRALRDKLRLLQPDEIRTRRKELRLTQRALADRIGVAQETISRWESGLVIQARAMDRLMRVFFEVPDARYVLAAEAEDSGVASNWFDWIGAGTALYATLPGTSVSVDFSTLPAAILGGQAQAMTVPVDLLDWQWPIVGEGSYEATTVDGLSGESPLRIAA